MADAAPVVMKTPTPGQRPSPKRRREEDSESEDEPRHFRRVRIRCRQRATNQSRSHEAEFETLISGEQTIRCICGAQNDLKSPANNISAWLIQCGDCKVWQHRSCVGTANGSDPPGGFYCERCPRASPYDLTKHEKTHSRPWKCNEASCKYSQYGWPTEKERDRHVNDKHFMTPNMYKCQYHPCPYESKRESNCKQHMEKVHGWAFVRSKNNGKSGKKATKVAKTPSTPHITTPSSYMFDASGSDFGGDSASPYMSHYSVAPSANGSPGNGSSHPSNFESPYLGENESMTSQFCRVIAGRRYGRTRLRERAE